MPLNDELSKSVEIRKTGTTTLGIVCKDGAILAAESKATLGYLIASKESEKIMQLEDHIAMTIAGSSGDAESLARYMKAELKIFSIENQRKISVKGAATLLSNILQGSKYYPYYVQLIVGGYDSTGAHVLTLDPLGSIEEERKFFSTGSGSPMALGVLEDAFKEGMSVDEASKLAMRAIKAAIERDIGSGGKALDIATITKDGIKVTRYDLDKISK
ncbi:MAG: archaeal proteasome endopeptidase complex subunit beta [Candidatus Aenigmarchaeota archaeon]|nr:archaeal proteasome endopeptidase complex subunit beta [Candidatus Aenigmarchaeota archaeon]